MPIMRKSSLIGTLAIGLSALLIYFFVQNQNAKQPLLSIPLGAGLIVAVICLVAATTANLALKTDAIRENREPSVAWMVFLGGFGVTTALVTVALYMLPEEARTIHGDFLNAPLDAMARTIGRTMEYVGKADWPVPLVLGLALLCALATAFGLFATTDLLGAANAAILGPIVGTLLVWLVVLAIALAVMLVVGAAMLAFVVVAALAKSESK